MLETKRPAWFSPINSVARPESRLGSDPSHSRAQGSSKITSIRRFRPIRRVYGPRRILQESDLPQLGMDLEGVFSLDGAQFRHRLSVAANAHPFAFRLHSGQEFGKPG